MSEQGAGLGLRAFAEPAPAPQGTDRERLIPKVMEQLNRLVSEQQDAVQRLEQRLAPVMRPLTPVPERGPDKIGQTVSPATLELVAIAGQIQLHTERLRIIERSLDL